VCCASARSRFALDSFEGRSAALLVSNAELKKALMVAVRLSPI
jgi:hypothetical protein